MNIDDIYKTFGKPVLHSEDKGDSNSLIITCDTGKRFRLKKNSKEAEYILRDINKHGSLDENGVSMGTVLKGVNGDSKTSRIYIVHADVKKRN